MMASFLVVALGPARTLSQTKTELTYEELVNELTEETAKLAQMNQQKPPGPTLHAGVGLLLTSLSIKPRQDRFQMSGFQVSLGIEVFSPHVIAEGIIRDFGTKTIGPQVYVLRELEAKLSYRIHPTNTQLKYRLGIGSIRQYLDYKDATNAIKESSPSIVFSSGLESQLNQNIVLCAGIDYREATTSTSIHRNSIDLTFSMEAFF